MHCRSCEILVEDNLKKIDGVQSVSVSQKYAQATVHYGTSKPSDIQIIQAIEAAGYRVGEREKLPWFSDNPVDYMYLVYSVIILAALFFIASATGLFKLNVGGGNTSLWIVPLVGLAAGFSTCMALIGGLVLGFSARHAELHPEATAVQKFRPHLFFNLGRIVGYAFFGGLIGLVGSVLQPSALVLGAMTLAVGLVMMFLGLKLIEIFPILRDKTLSLPKSIARIFGIRNETKEYSHKNVIITGALTFFLPCGFTQAMQLYAVSSGSFIQGSLIMGLFALGTAPGLLGIGGLSSFLKGVTARLFFTSAGVAVLILGLYNVSNARGLIFTGASAASTVSAAAAAVGPVQEIRMTQNDFGYQPGVLTVEKGRPVRWIITSTGGFSCASSIYVPKYRIKKNLKKGENIIEFTPTEKGEIPFSCSMGMYRGKFIVVDRGTALQPTTGPQAAAKAPAASCSSSGGGGCGGCGGGAAAKTQTNGTVTIEKVNGKTTQLIQTVYQAQTDISPNTFSVKAGMPVRMVINAKDDGRGCMSSIMVPGLYDRPQLLQKNEPIVMDFTPTQPGEYKITCAMGMPRGSITVNKL